MYINKTRIIIANEEHIEYLLPLITQYLDLYKKKFSENEIYSYLFDRLNNNESVIFLALYSEGDVLEPVGFIQIYPGFSTIELKRIWNLSEIFVKPDFRRIGIATKLLEKTISFAKNTNSESIISQINKTDLKTESFLKKSHFIIDDNQLHYKLNFER